MRMALTVLTALLLGGCAFGRTYSYADAPINIPGPSVSSTTVAIGVQDRRPYVLSGGKSERFVGLMRGGFGNPFDVNTQSGAALASEMRDAVARAMKGKGYSVMPITLSPHDAASTARRKVAESGAKRGVLITFTEWKSDSMMNTAVHYDVALSVLNEKGEPVATNSLKGVDNIGSAGLSPNASISATFARKFEALFDDEKVAAALRN